MIAARVWSGSGVRAGAIPEGRQEEFDGGNERRMERCARLLERCSLNPWNGNEKRSKL